MRAKKLGRHDLLNWVNTLTQSDYPKIENLSDGVGFCQIFDAFYPNIVNLNSLKLNSKNEEDYEKNFSIFNDILIKIKSLKQIDVNKLSKSKFTVNFELLQFIYDLIAKNFGDVNIRYNAFEKRSEIIKNQYGNKGILDIKKYLPTHLIPNDLILKIDKQKFFGSNNNLELNENIQNVNINQPENENSINTSSVVSNLQINTMLDKYKDFFSILKDDLQKMVNSNSNLSNDINDIEEERNYYLEKINNVFKFCEKKINSGKIKIESKNMLQNIMSIVKHIPEDFK